MLRIALKKKKSKLAKDNINTMLRIALKKKKSKLEKDNINTMLRIALKKKVNAKGQHKYDASRRINKVNRRKRLEYVRNYREKPLDF